MARMTNLHEKQTNVMKRNKQQANKKAAKENKPGLAGAAERMRNFVTQVSCTLPIEEVHC